MSALSGYKMRFLLDIYFHDQTIIIIYIYIYIYIYIKSKLGITHHITAWKPHM